MTQEQIPFRFPAPQCPDHGDTMERAIKEIRMGYRNIVRKRAIIWHCKVKNCGKWCEETLGDIMWP